MSKFLIVVLLLFYHTLYAQLQPAMVSIQGIGGDKIDQVLPVVVPTAGGFIIHFETNSNASTGNINSFCASTTGRAIFVKYNIEASTVEWSKCYSYDGDSFVVYLFPTSDGGNILGGEFNSDNGWGLQISKEDAAGNILWQKNYSKGKGAILRSMIKTDDGGFIMLAESLYIDTNVTIHYGGWMNADFWVLKLDSNGNKIWSKVIGGSGHESGAALVAGPGNSVYVVGGTGSYDYDCTGNHGGGEAYVARLDVDGNILWHRDLGGTDMDVATAACSNGNGGLIIGAQTRSADGDVHGSNGGSEYWAIEMDSDNIVLWSSCYGTEEDEIPLAICKAADGTIWMNGFTYANYDDAWIVHASATGNLLSARALGGTRQDRGQMIYPLQGGAVIAGGCYTNNDGDFSQLLRYGSALMVDAFLAIFAPWTSDIDPISSHGTFKVYPSPAHNVIHIEVGDKSPHTAHISIVDVTGRQIYNDSISQECTISIKDWAAGIYFLQVTTENGYKEIQKLIVQ